MTRRRRHNFDARRRAAAAGFTLVEVLATLVLLGIVVPVAMRGVSLALAAASTARRTAEAASLAEGKLNELIVDGTWQTSGNTGDFAAENRPEYSWTCENASRDYGTYEVILRVAWNQQGRERTLSLATLVYPNAMTGAAGTTDTNATAPDPAAAGGAQ